MYVHGEIESFVNLKDMIKSLIDPTELYLPSEKFEETHPLVIANIVLDKINDFKVIGPDEYDYIPNVDALYNYIQNDGFKDSRWVLYMTDGYAMTLPECHFTLDGKLLNLEDPKNWLTVFIKNIDGTFEMWLFTVTLEGKFLLINAESTNGIDWTRNPVADNQYMRQRACLYETNSAVTNAIDEMLVYTECAPYYTASPHGFYTPEEMILNAQKVELLLELGDIESPLRTTFEEYLDMDPDLRTLGCCINDPKTPLTKLFNSKVYTYIYESYDDFKNHNPVEKYSVSEPSEVDIITHLLLRGDVDEDSDSAVTYPFTTIVQIKLPKISYLYGIDDKFENGEYHSRHYLIEVDKDWKMDDQDRSKPMSWEDECCASFKAVGDLLDFLKIHAQD